jgi:hypothetical protein
MQIMGTTSLAIFLIVSLIFTFCSICVSTCFSLTVCFIADALSLSLQCSASYTHTHTHTHSVFSVILLSSHHFPFDIKTLINISTSSLITINCLRMHCCFIWKIAYNNCSNNRVKFCLLSRERK